MLNRVLLANLPSPLHRLDRISEHWNGNIWVKRDDLTESGLMGNKVRKLEFLLAEAKDLKADTIITCGAAQSNHCRATALAAAKLDFNCILLMRGAKPDVIEGNLLLDRLSGAEMVFIPIKRYYNDLDGELNRLATNVQKAGGKAYLIPEGGSNPVGAWGYTEALKEIRRQCFKYRFKPDRIVFATGSAGTHAGLLVGALIENWDVEIVSVSVCYSKDETMDRILKIINGMIDRFRLDIRISRSDISVVDGYVGEGYAKAGREVFEVITEMTRLEGLILDPVYTGKAALGIKGEIAKGNLPGKTIFLHTGGVFGLFPFKEDIIREVG